MIRAFVNPEGFLFIVGGSHHFCWVDLFVVRSFVVVMTDVHSVGGNVAEIFEDVLDCFIEVLFGVQVFHVAYRQMKFIFGAEVLEIFVVWQFVWQLESQCD